MPLDPKVEKTVMDTYSISFNSDPDRTMLWVWPDSLYSWSIKAGECEGLSTTGLRDIASGILQVAEQIDEAERLRS